MNNRVARIGDLLRAELSEIIRRDLRDPRVQLATVSDVQVSRDLSHANVRVSVLGEGDERSECVEVLEKAKGFIRRQLARRTRLRTVPDLVFHLDRGAEHSQKINEILENLYDDADELDPPPAVAAATEANEP